MLVCGTMPWGRKIMCPQNQVSRQKGALFGPKNVCPFQILDLTLDLLKAEGGTKLT